MKNALCVLLLAGLARRHRGNPAASLRLSQLYGAPVLLSGLSSLVIDGHNLSTLQKLLRFHERTPRAMIYFLAGSLPASALIHQRQMSLFSMICHLKDDPLNKHAQYVIMQKLKCLVKTRITGYWEQLLAPEAAQLDSLSHFNPYGHHPPL